MVKLLIIVIAGSFPVMLSAQEPHKLALPQAYEMARKNYPVVKQKELIRRTAGISIENLNRGYWPQFSMNAQLSYQSDVTEVPVKIPGLVIESPSKDQYRLVADMSQLLYDGGVTKQQKTLQELQASVEDQKVEVELYKLKERVDQVYLGILFLDEQLKQVELVKNDISTGLKRVEAQVQNGVAFKSNLSLLKAELLKADQRAVEISASKKGLIDVLSLLLGRHLGEMVELEKPVAPGMGAEGLITRPELALYREQLSLVGHQGKLINAKNLPRANLFIQGGYGRPGLNMLKNEFDLYYIGGIRLNWSLGGLYTKKREKEQVEVNRQIVEIQQETFLLNTTTQLKEVLAQIAKLKQLIVSDQEIIILRRSVTDAARAQLENGVITANDYLGEVNAEDQARQLLITHEIQLLQAQINYQTISGKQ